MANKKKRKAGKFKMQRRLGVELPGLGKAGALERRPYPPGQNGNRRKKYSDYALRLEEKQKIRFHYGLREEQFRHFIRRAKRGPGANWVEKLVGLLECRLDNLIFRLGFAPSIAAASQLISHGHIEVDGKKIDIRSSIIRPGQKITVREKSRENQVVLQAKQSPRLELADFLRVEEQNGASVGMVHAIPGLTHVPFSFDSGLLTEYYAARKV